MTHIPSKENRPAVFFGGGSGASAVLEFAKLYWKFLTSIHGVFDRGGSTAHFHKRGHVALGDLRRAIVALATRTEQNAAMYDCMKGRFPNISGAPFNDDAGGNIILALLSELNGHDLMKAIRMVEKNLGNTARVLPVSLMRADMHSFLLTHTVMVHQGQIKNCNEPAHAIMSASLMPYPGLYVGAREAILDAGRKGGVFIVTAGSLFDSILAPLLVRGMEETLTEFVSLGGRIIQIVNAMNQPHQSEDFSSEKHIEYLLTHINKKSIYAAIVNTGKIPDSVLKLNREKDGSVPVPYKPSKSVRHMICGDFVTWDVTTGHISQNEAVIKAVYALT